MPEKIKHDHSRFKQIIRGKIRDNLKKYISKGEMIGKQGKDRISIPMPQIELPRFRFGDKDSGGVGQGDGEEGDPLGQGEAQGSGKGEAGDKPGEHVIEMDVTLDEMADILGEELGLPRIEPRGSKIVSEKLRYIGVRQTGPESLRHFKRTYKEALKRQIASGTYNPDRPIIIPVREDRRYRSWKVVEEPQANAVILYMMDVSGSMGEEQKEIVRIESFWIDTWLRKNYKGLERRFIIHDAAAREVDEDTFFHTKESGGTMISSAYNVAVEIMEADYNPAQWNIYMFHFSDGDNWSTDDTGRSIKILEERILPHVNQFGYGQVDSPYGSGQFIKDLREHLGEVKVLVLSEIKGKDQILESIKDFLKAGR